jgi:hypothetical protein
MVMTLLYRTAEWHAFAKLQLHTESTLLRLEWLTTELGLLTRKFRDTTQSAFATFELPKETEARKRRQNSGKGKEKAASGGKKSKILNLFTYKWHALGDYVPTIHLFGSTSGFSTQVVSIFFSLCIDLFTLSVSQGELAHKIVKRLYGLTNKRNAEHQIAKRYRRLERARSALDRKRLHGRLMKQKTTIQEHNEPDGDSELRYYISPSKNYPQDIFGTLRNNKDDPAYHVSFS